VMDAGTGAHWTGNELLVVEADESDGTHVELPLTGSILLNVELDYLQHYGTFDALRSSFDRFLAQVDGPRVLCADDPVCADLAARHPSITYGVARTADFRPVELRANTGSFSFAVERRGDRLGTDGDRVHLPLRGVHNVVNATGAIAMALELGASFECCRDALARFGGVARRFDIRGVDGGATFVDDYAHLPAEIAAVIAAARDSGDGWSRVVVAFQPNRFNRIAEMWREYEHAFVGADVVVITEIYPSGTTPIPGVTGKLIVNAVVDAHPRARMLWLPRREDVVSFLAGEVGPGDVCISMGCGDIASLPEEILARRAARRAP
jgi:UDP-N-acetylmuramate--alanine ligase